MATKKLEGVHGEIFIVAAHVAAISPNEHNKGWSTIHLVGGGQLASKASVEAVVAAIFPSKPMAL